MLDSDPEELGYTPQGKGVEEAFDETRALSSELLDILSLKGAEYSRSGGSTGACSVDPEMKNGIFHILHTWSVHDVANQDLERAMNNLREELPKKGWEILFDGESDTRSQHPKIEAEEPEKRYALKVDWRKHWDEPMITVMLQSACFQAPEGDDPSSYH